MKAFNKFIYSVIFLMAASLVHAHGNHEDEQPITKSAAAVRGEMIMGALISDKKLDSSWQQKKIKEVVSRVTPAGVLWIISYNNPAETAKDKQTIYILLDDVGNYIGANHTGKY